MPNKLVTVFMPVFNRERYVAEAIQSVLNQTYQDFELLIINDGSTDGTVNVISQFSDPRIRLLHNSRNCGLVETRNFGLQEAKGAYIALIDSDDLMHPNRLEKQLVYLNRNEDIVGAGSRAQYIDSNGHVIRNSRNHPTRPASVKIGLLFYVAIMNQTFTGRLSILKEYTYDEKFKVCEDYDLFCRISNSHKLSNLPDKLTKVRKHESNISSTMNSSLEQLRLQIMHRQLIALGINPTKNDLIRHRRLAFPKGPLLQDSDFYYWAIRWLTLLMNANKINNIYEKSYFGRYILSLRRRLIAKSIKYKGFKFASRLLATSICEIGN